MRGGKSAGAGRGRGRGRDRLGLAPQIDHFNLFLPWTTHDARPGGNFHPLVAARVVGSILARPNR